MTKLTLGSHPFLLGFVNSNGWWNARPRPTRTDYPPYNIEESGGNAISDHAGRGRFRRG